MKKLSLKHILFCIIAAIIVIAGYAYWRHEQLYPSTDDAYIDGHIINIAAQVNGKIQQVFVQNQQIVTKNTLLFTIDPTPFQIAYDKAVANLSNTKQEITAEQQAVQVAQAHLLQQEAELVDAQKNDDRISPLVKKGYVAKSGGDNALRKLNVAKQAVEGAKDQLSEAKAKLGATGDANAQLQAAKAMVAQAALNLQYTKVYAPESGELAQFTLQPGQTITAYQTLFSLVASNEWWANANMKETALERIHPGQKATVILDMYPNHPFHGIVHSIAASSGSTFSLMPPENATGNWVKVTQRFPVRIKILDPNSAFPLRVGASCSVVVDTKK